MGEEGNGRGYESLWKAQEGEEVQMTFDEVCVRARAFEKRSVREYWVVLVLLGFLVAVMILYLFRFSEPMMRIGIASILAALLYMGVRGTRSGPPRRLRAGAQPDTCVNFLRSELARKREELLKGRWTVWLLFPGMFAFWWGGGPVAVAKWMGTDLPWLTRYQESPMPLIVILAVFACVWVVSGREARRIQREIEELGGEQPGE